MRVAELAGPGHSGAVPLDEAAHLVFDRHQAAAVEDFAVLTETRTTDAKGRLVLPKAFANATVIVEQVSETEVRVRRARVVAENELQFAEDSAPPLSDRDRDRFLDLLARPPAPKRALKRAAARARARRG